MARPGLFDALKKFELLSQARVICTADGSDADKASQLEVLLAEAGSDFAVSPRAVFIVRHRLTEGGDKAPEKEPPSSPNSGTPPKDVAKRNGRSGKRPMRPDDGRKGNRAPPGPHSTGFKEGNDAATVTGRHRNPLLHGVSQERQKLAGIEGMTPNEMLGDAIESYRLLVMDLTTELEVVKSAQTRWVWLGSTYTRQEGDGEIMGTGRIAQRKRMPRLEAITRLSKDIASVQRSYNKAVKDLHDMQKGAPPEDPQAGLRALAEAIKSSKDRLKGQNGSGGEKA